MDWAHSVTLLCILVGAVAVERPTRWCSVSDAEEVKCKNFQKILNDILLDKTIPDEDKDGIPSNFQCVRSVDVFECMKKIADDYADLMTLDPGQGYFAGRYHNMNPVVAENYDNIPQEKPTYYAVSVFRASNPITLETLRNNKNICFPGIGTSAGWLYPISQLLEKKYIPVTECNAIVKSVTSFFNSMCLPGALTSFYNPFGNNPTSVCELCNGQGEERCSTSDPSAGYDGAFRCMAQGRGDLTFLRHDTVGMMTRNDPNYNEEDYRLLCPDGNQRAISDYEQCNWGIIPSHIVMTSGVREKPVIAGYKKFLLKASDWFKQGGLYSSRFQLFSSENIHDNLGTAYKRKNLMFSDSTLQLEDVKTHTYYSWVGSEFVNILTKMNLCPLEVARWCVVSLPEKLKCETMIMAFKAKDLRPELDCLLGKDTTSCMDMIAKGDADLMNLDAGDVYLAGRKYNLIPIAAEDYGDMSMKFKVVAAARKTDKILTLFNMKGNLLLPHRLLFPISSKASYMDFPTDRTAHTMAFDEPVVDHWLEQKIAQWKTSTHGKRSCQPGIGRGDGWIVPLNIYIETEQFLPGDCSIFKNLGELFIRSCIPGSLDHEYNPGQSPISLCEGCGANGFRKCMRNAEEQYYGAAGAFRCLVERGGDVAFIRHLTVRDNTDGRNHANWARNRRSDDYELLCKDGSRVNIDKFASCHLGEVPGNAIVTANHKDINSREIYWNLLNYGQQFFSSDIDGDFHMFDSGTWYTDLMFTDAAVRLMKIPADKQNYLEWLGPDFVGQIENLQKYTCVSPDSAASLSPHIILLLVLYSFVQLLL